MAIAASRMDITPLALAPDAGSVPMARAWIADRMRDQRSDVLDDALVIVSELVTNAVLHVGLPGIYVLAYRGRTGPVLEVRDASRTPPRPRPRRAGGDGLDIGGRGLRMVDELALRWGWCHLPTGKSVWAVLRTPRSALPASRARAERRVES